MIQFPIRWSSRTSQLLTGRIPAAPGQTTARSSPGEQMIVGCLKYARRFSVVLNNNRHGVALYLKKRKLVFIREVFVYSRIFDVACFMFKNGCETFGCFLVRVPVSLCIVGNNKKLSGGLTQSRQEEKSGHFPKQENN